MNSGTESHVDLCIERQRALADGQESYDPHWHESEAEREARLHYVTIHRYRHADERQVTYTHANSSYDLYDLIRGVELGYLDAVSNPEAWVRIHREICHELRQQAMALERATRAWEFRQPKKSLTQPAD